MLPETVIFPPRPQGRQLAVHLPRLEKARTHVIQRKFNGKHVVVWVDVAEGEVGIWGREQEKLDRFRPTPKLFRQFLSLNLDADARFYWFAGELLHQKTTDPHYQGKIVLFDMLGSGQRGGDCALFVRSPDQMGRLALLDDACRHPQKLESKYGIALVVTEDIWMAQTWDRDFWLTSKRLFH